MHFHVSSPCFHVGSVSEVSNCVVFCSTYIQTSIITYLFNDYKTRSTFLFMVLEGRPGRSISTAQVTAFLNPDRTLVAVVLNQTKHYRDLMGDAGDGTGWGNQRVTYLCQIPSAIRSIPWSHGL